MCQIFFFALQGLPKKLPISLPSDGVFHLAAEQKHLQKILTFVFQIAFWVQGEKHLCTAKKK